MTNLAIRLSQAAVLVPGPFNCHPLKPLLNAALGSGYDSAYEHFRRDHSLPSNLGLHCICLAFQLAANFALLACLDEALGLTNVGLGSLTAGVWIISLALGTTQSPGSTIISAVLIVAALLASVC